MWRDTQLRELLGIEHPIIQAPVAGTTTSDLAAAVSNTGGLGSHGYATLSPEASKRDIAVLAAWTSRPVHFNFFCHAAPQIDADHHDTLLNAIDPHYTAACGKCRCPPVFPLRSICALGPERAGGPATGGFGQ